jgi:hypothetical protein
VPLFVNYFCDMGIYIYFMASLAMGHIGVTTGDFLTILLCASVQGASSTCVGHELYHRRNIVFKFFGLIAHMKFLHGHIPIYHNEIHHKHTGIVVKDFGFSPRGNSIYKHFEIMGLRSRFQTINYDD